MFAPDDGGGVPVFRAEVNQFDQTRWLFLLVGVIVGYAVAKSR